MLAVDMLAVDTSGAVAPGVDMLAVDMAGAVASAGDFRGARCPSPPRSGREILSAPPRRASEDFRCRTLAGDEHAAEAAEYHARALAPFLILGKG